MEDATIEVLVQLQDQMSNQLKVISANLDILTKNSDVTTQKVQQGFTGGLQSLLSFGMGVRAIDEISAQYINTQLRLENAANRVENAQDRLANAQDNLNKLQQSGTATTEQLTKAQTQIEISTRQLEIAQNNLERSKEQAIGSIITMGINIIQLVVALDNWRKAQEGVNIATAIGTALTKPLNLAIGLAAAAAGVYAINSLMASSATTDFANAQGKLDNAITAATGKLNDQIKLINDQYKDQTAQNNQMSDEEKKAKDDIIDQEERVRQAKLAINNATANDNLRALHNRLESETATLDYLKNTYQTDYEDKRKIQQEKLDLDKNYAINNLQVMIDSYNQQLVIIDDFTKNAVQKLNNVSQAQYNIIHFTGNMVTANTGPSTIGYNINNAVNTLNTIPLTINLSNTVKLDSTTLDRNLVQTYGTKISY